MLKKVFLFCMVKMNYIQGQYQRLQLLLVIIIIMYLGFTCGQDAIVSEITRHTSPTGQSAFIHHRRQFPQKLQQKGNQIAILPIVIIWRISIITTSKRTKHHIFNFGCRIGFDLSWYCSGLTCKRKIIMYFFFRLIENIWIFEI